MSDGYGLVKELFRQCHSVITICDKSHFAFEKASYGTECDVHKKFVPNELLNVLVNPHVEAASVKSCFEFRQEGICVRY